MAINSYGNFPSAQGSRTSTQDWLLGFSAAGSRMESGPCARAGPLSLTIARSASDVPDGNTSDQRPDLVPPPAGYVFRRPGSVNENFDPTPGVEVAQMAPPCESMIFLQMARPIPVPAISLPCKRLNIPKIWLA